MSDSGHSDKESLALDVAALREKLGPVKVGLIERWIREVNGPYDAMIEQAMSADSLVLDVGCSRGDPDLPSMYTGRGVIGADMDVLGLRANDMADGCVLAPMDVLPFADNSFDVVVCKWVVEHLEDPAGAFAECARVLKPGGAIAVLTPNGWSVFTLISTLMPFRLKQILKGRMFGGHEEDTFRTWYRANTLGALERVMGAAGFDCVEKALLPGMWTFFIFNRPLALLVRWVEHVQIKLPGVRNLSTYIVGVWKKLDV